MCLFVAKKECSKLGLERIGTGWDVRMVERVYRHFCLGKAQNTGKDHGNEANGT